MYLIIQVKLLLLCIYIHTVNKTAAGSHGKLFIRSAHLLDTTCSRQPTEEELATELEKLSSDGAYNLHTLLLVGLIPIVNYINFGGSATHVVSQGALRTKMLIKYYGTTEFPVLCQFEPEISCKGLSFEAALFKARAKVIGMHLELDNRRPVTVYDILFLLKRYHEAILLPLEAKEDACSKKKGRGRSSKFVTSLLLLTEMYASILQIARMNEPSMHAMERIGRFVMAVNVDVLKSFTDWIPRNIVNISYIFSSDWKKISCDDAKFVLKWLGRPTLMSSVAFTQLFNAVVAGKKGTALQKAVISSYKRMLRSEPDSDSDSDSEDKNVKLFKDAAAAVKNATVAGKKGVSSSVVVSTSRTISFFFACPKFPSFGHCLSLCALSTGREKGGHNVGYVGFGLEATGAFAGMHRISLPHHALPHNRPRVLQVGREGS